MSATSTVTAPAAIMTNNKPSADNNANPSPSTHLSPGITTITISEVARDYDTSARQSPEHSYNNNTTATATFTAAEHLEKHPHLLLNTSTYSSATRHTLADNDDAADGSNTSQVVQMAVDELRAMGETLRRATKQQQRMIEETMSQWRTAQQGTSATTTATASQ